jgi:hypothetical protein
MGQYEQLQGKYGPRVKNGHGVWKQVGKGKEFVLFRGLFHHQRLSTHFVISTECQINEG